MTQENSKWHVIFPMGDRSKLAVVEITAALSYELRDYTVASRHAYDEPGKAANRARELAKMYGLEYLPDRSVPETCYLD